MTSKSRNFFLAIAILLILITLNQFFLDEVKNTFYIITSPIQNIFWKKGEEFSGFLQTLIKIRSLKVENEELLRQNQEFLSITGEVKDLRKENQALKEVLDLELEKDFELILVEVISKETAGDFILISKGGEDGISEGMPVITKEKIVVGIIEKVYKNFSRISLLSNQKSSFDIEIQNEEGDEIYGLAQGEGNLRIQLKFVPQEEKITEGDIVFTTVLAGIFPKGLLVGEIGQVKKSDLSAFQEAEINPYFKRSLSEILFVIKNFVPKKEL